CDRVVVRRVGCRGLLGAHYARRCTSGDELPHHNHSELRHGASPYVACRNPARFERPASAAPCFPAPIILDRRPGRLVASCWLLATANGARPTSPELEGPATSN